MGSGVQQRGDKNLIVSRFKGNNGIGSIKWNGEWEAGVEREYREG